MKGSKTKFGIFEVLGEFWRGVEEPRSYKIYSSGNRGVKKGPGPRGSRDEEFLVPSLMHSVETLSAFCLSAAQPMLSLASSGSRVYLIVVLMLKQTFNIQKIVNKYIGACSYYLFL